MITSKHRAVVAAALTIFAAALYTTPASAMGRPSTRSGQPSIGRAVDRLGQVEADQKHMVAALHSQMDVLRQELAHLKARIALIPGVASAE